MCTWEPANSPCMKVENERCTPSLRGRILTVIHATRVDKKVLNASDELVATLRDSFGLDTPEAATLWPSICARHEAIFARRSEQVT
jgi:N-hydroxyarylamine O-acetyltransferase